MAYPIDRAHYRILYPLNERPSLRTGDDAYEVIDCSEGGLRYALGDGPSPEVGTELRGTISFRTGDDCEVSGNVVRVQAGGVAVRLIGAGIPLAIILEEQRYLRRNYPMREG